MLAKARSVHATFTALEAGYVHVTVAADLGGTRGGYLGGAAALGSVGIAGAIILLTLGAFPVIAIAPVALGAGLGYGTVRQYQPLAERTLLGLERALDHLEQGGVKPRHELPPRAPSLTNLIGEEIRKAIAKSSGGKGPK
jgi:hypothetical protein